MVHITIRVCLLGHASLGDAGSISVPLTRNMPYLSHPCSLISHTCHRYLTVPSASLSRPSALLSPAALLLCQSPTHASPAKSGCRCPHPAPIPIIHRQSAARPVPFSIARTGGNCTEELVSSTGVDCSAANIVFWLFGRNFAHIQTEWT